MNKLPLNDPTRPLCQHCHREVATRAHGLGSKCSHNPDIRKLYPSTSKYACHGVGNPRGPGTPGQPTTALPGSHAKIAVLEDRAAHSQNLFHPDDAQHL